MKRAIKLIPLVLLLAQTSVDYARQMSGLLATIFFALLMFVFPVLIIYGIFRSVLDVFKPGRRMYAPRLSLMLIPVLVAQTTQNIDMARQLFDTIAAYLGIFFAFLLPGFFILLLVKALTKLIKM